MRTYLVGYKRSRFMFNREFAVEEEKSEWGAIKWDSFRVIKKLRSKPLPKDVEQVAGDYCEARGLERTKANIRQAALDLEIKK